MQEKRACQSSAHDLAGEDRDRMRAAAGVERLHQPERRDRAARCRDARASPSAWTPASVRPAAWTATASPVIACAALLDRLLHARAVRLALPAHERAGRHIRWSARSGSRSCVPAGIAKAAQQFVCRHDAAPGALDAGSGGSRRRRRRSSDRRRAPSPGASRHRRPARWRRRACGCARRRSRRRRPAPD